MMSDEKNLGVSQKLVSPSRSTSSCSSKQGSRQDSWEVVEGLRGEMSYTQEPPVQKGFLLKKRKWPLKGWHKRFFYLDKGILKYAKSQTDIEREKLHGCIDVGLSVMSVKKSSKCIDLDTEEHIYHLKVKSEEVFDEWVSKLRHHRMYRQNEIAMFPHEVNHFFSGSTVTDSASGVFDSISSRKRSSISKQNLFQTGSNVSFSCGGETRVPLWLQSSEDMEKCSKDLAHCHAYLVEMSQLLQSMDVLHRTYSAPAINAIQGGAFESPKKEKRPQRRWRSRAIGKDAKGTLQENSRDENRALVHQLSNESRLSITDSLSEFFDAQEVLLSPSSSENEISDDDSYVSDISDNLSLDNLSNDLDNERQTLGPVLESGAEAKSRRRTCLPAPCPSSSNISLWNILRNNIGKDLSKVAMPVELNEPLNTLQRLCEELEYSELLDKAAQIPSPLERMVYVAAFAISAYASSYYRAGSKPFNPVLGETYECIREDKGFQFFSEQVSHHPPISACHAESRNFVFWQDVRWKNKFWGKSMEIVPIGTTHVTLPAFGDHFEWNKVTSCIHNILSGQRWIEHYGEIVIKNLNDDSCYCKVNFIKAKYWSTNAHEIEGTVFDRSGNAVHRLFGKWHESIYCGGSSSSACVWRANPMPKGYEQYYGFTQFALELNEMDLSSKSLLPPTDTRFRPDQRFLEEGNLEEAEIQKQRIEQLQRERRRVLEENHVEHQPRFFRKSDDDSWLSNGTYLELRKDLGFSKLDHPVLW
ncbi:oxysterol-binding protein-related protein 3 isoform X5 [Rhinopithecus roxellana]|uniref:oxysterol-binding protein-related protein 3 isoform X5 n=1 Tax=Rhinopithecus roxellana TaxID=61622 RepID=UPI0012377A01|nr:oxysterol-binding protein-related protein 3 isoform X5 [Rhinopithecus roxellana]